MRAHQVQANPGKPFRSVSFGTHQRQRGSPRLAFDRVLMFDCPEWNGFLKLRSVIIGGMWRRKSEKLSDKALLSQVKKALGKPRIAKSTRKSDSQEAAISDRRSVPKVHKAK